MNFRTLLLLALGGFVAINAPAQTVIQNTTYSSGQNRTVEGPATITANSAVTVSGGAVVKYRATASVTLGTGFTASANSSFRAFIFVDTDGDGMDDSWETRNGLNPGSNADASVDTDNDGMSNLAEYLLGTNPTAITPPDTSNPTLLKVHRPQS